MQFECNADEKIPIKTFLYENKQCSKTLIISENTKIKSRPESLLYGASVHNGLMKNSGFIGSYTHFSLAHLWFIQFLPIM